MVDLCMTHAGKLALRGRTVVAGSGDAGYTNVGEEGNDISDTDPDCSVARPFYPSNRLVFCWDGVRLKIVVLNVECVVC